MTKTILLTITLLACSAWMMAQSTSTPSSSQSPDTSSTPSSSTAGQSSSGSSASQSGSQAGSETSQSSGSMNNSGSETTIRGCLNSSGGGYTLTDASGTTYQLQGDTSKLSSHVNNEVEIKGTASGASGAGAASSTSPSASSTSPSTGSSASTGSTTGSAAGQMFNVTKVKKVSGTCSTSK